MTKRAVWIVCFVIALLGAASVAYRVAKVTHFDSTEWRAADENSEFLQRRAMMPDVEILFAGGKLSNRDSVIKLFGNAERTADDDPNTWYYNLGGESSSAAPDSITWLELKFDETGRLASHRVMQELIVPDLAANPPK
jgi:hypothetical protein